MCTTRIATVKLAVVLGTGEACTGSNVVVTASRSTRFGAGAVPRRCVVLVCVVCAVYVCVCVGVCV